jgi:hypothetical protein
MRRRVWGPVAVIVALFVAIGALPRIDLRMWSAPVTGQPWLAAPSWPVPALREFRFAWAGLERSAFMPSWPVPGLRTFAPRWTMTSLGVTDHTQGPASGPIEAASRVRWLQAVLRAWLAVTLAFAATWVPRARAARRGQRHASITARVRTLAERGVDAGRIAQHAGLPRDAVRGLMRTAAARRRS